MRGELFLETVLSAALVTSAIFGLLIGAFYGYSNGNAAARIVYPYTLWLVGIGWLATVAILALFGEGPFLIESQLGRAVLWTILCLAIAIGRWIRIHVELWRIRRRTQELEE